MKPEEKAIELLNKFSSVGIQMRHEVLECALIAADEIIQSIIEVESELNAEDISAEQQYWIRIKQQLEKL